MKHLKRGRKFGRRRNQRRALMKSLASSFFVMGRIKTTEAKAKELRPMAEKIITRAQNPSLGNTRILRKSFAEKVVKKIMKQAKSVQGRKGGYTRIIKIGPRKRDGARMAIIELI